MAAGAEDVQLVDIGMPKLSDSMEEATVVAWLKRPGDAIVRGEPLVEVETDKATVVYEAETAGVLEAILVGEGETTALGAAIATLRATAGPAPAPAAPVPAAPAPAPARAARAADAPAKPERARATPVARRLAGELGVSLADLAGSGPGGRIVAADVEAARRDAGAPAEGSANGRGAVTERPHTATQRTIARRMAESRATIPEFTVETEIAMDAAVAFRDDLRAGGVDPLPSYNDLLVRAVALALRDFPALNASYAEGRTLLYERINVGIAVETGDALLVPTVRDADRRSLLELAAETRRLAAGARDRSLAPADLADGTFTVSNLGMLGVRRFNAVIHAPQAAILAAGEVCERPAVEAGRLVVRTAMDVALSCDHRVVYGAEAARFLQRLRALLEHPALQLIDGGGR